MYGDGATIYGFVRLLDLPNDNLEGRSLFVIGNSVCSLSPFTQRVLFTPRTIELN